MEAAGFKRKKDSDGSDTSQSETHKPGIFDLPEEIFHHIVSYLSLQDICQFGAICRYAYFLTHNERFWTFQILKEWRLVFVKDAGELETAWPSSKFNIQGILCDPHLVGNRELFIIYSSEFRRLTRDKSAKKKRKDPFRTMLESNSMKDMLPRLLAFYVSLPQEEQCSARLVLFGPGIESERTHDLVHKIVNARSSTFDAIQFIRGLQGGVGSGVRINYKHIYNFDLMCLYTNRQNERLNNKGEARLDPRNNVTVMEDSDGTISLRPEIVKLLPTLHALVFAIDATDTQEENYMESLNIMRKELDVILRGLDTFRIQLPLVVLACTQASVTSSQGLSPGGARSVSNHKISVKDIITGLRLQEFPSAWGVWEVEVENMRGAEKGFDWVLHHLRKKRKDWNYHQIQGQN